MPDESRGKENQDGSDWVSANNRLPVIDTQKIFGAAPEVLIRHGADVYRLRITKSGKLILTK